MGWDGIESLTGRRRHSHPVREVVGSYIPKRYPQGAKNNPSSPQDETRSRSYQCYLNHTYCTLPIQEVWMGCTCRVAALV